MKINSIHFVGIKGVGMTPLAVIAKEAGMKVSGSDIGETFITDEILKKAKIIPLVGFSKNHIGNPDLVITTGAHGGFTNVEVIEAKKKEIKVITQGEAVGIFMKGKIFGREQIGISVTGTHGKTTTTAIIATILKGCYLDPSFLIGTGNVLSLGSSGHFGQGKYFIAEADEYMTEPVFDKTIKFLWQYPKIAIFTNIEFDHPDAYKSLDDVKKAFLKFANQLSEDAVLIACQDNENVAEVLKSYSGRRITYGFSKETDFVIENVKSKNGKLEFDLTGKGKSLGKFKLNVFGKHNALNATAAIIASLEAGLPIGAIKKALLLFVGTKRRSEYIGKLSTGAMVFDDYAHHPTEIRNTLSAFRNSFPRNKIVCIFQPHTYSRTKSLFEQFIHSFNDADIVVLTNIYASLREQPDSTVSSEMLAEKMSRFKKNVIFLPKLSDVVKYISQKQFGRDTIIITMGAGDVYRMNERLNIKD
ncbi:MAG: UDP-N-acetylmuramate--L-alanine ligase [Candidatus Levybacteria bacterium]|nr:UDP-N-acetylmuramate--L-alanine ligase [Candidatus Levybacteria bacterium]